MCTLAEPPFISKLEHASERHGPVIGYSSELEIVMPSRPTTSTKPVKRQKSSRAEPHFKYVRSLERGLAIIAAFNEHHPQLTLADVGRAAGLDRSTARRFLLTLKALGYVEQNDRLFFLAPRTLQLGYGYLASLPWWRAAQNISEQLTRKIGASSAVGVLDHNSVVYVAYATAGRFPLLMNRWVGTYLPAIATAIGRVLLAELDADEIRQRLKASSIEQYTPVTRTSHAELKVLLEKAHRTGYALVDQELELGLQALGVPVRNRSGVAVAGLSISFLEAQLTTERIIERYLGPLQDAARQITESLPA
jgi:IclR family transcriptional regulator, pca regulon regulatory protein